METGDYTKVGGEEGWEEIVRKNQEANGSFEFNLYFSNSQGYALLLNEYIFVKACLMKLALEVDLEVVAMLKEKGYRISTESSEKYAETLFSALRKSENLITRTVQKQKELDQMSKDRGGSRAGFEEVMANLNFGLGFTVPDSITLARYNEYRKILKQKFKKHGNIHENK